MHVGTWARRCSWLHPWQRGHRSGHRRDRRCSRERRRARGRGAGSRTCRRRTGSGADRSVRRGSGNRGREGKGHRTRTALRKGRRHSADRRLLSAHIERPSASSAVHGICDVTATGPAPETKGEQRRRPRKPGPVGGLIGSSGTRARHEQPAARRSEEATPPDHRESRERHGRGQHDRQWTGPELAGVHRWGKAVRRSSASARSPR